MELSQRLANLKFFAHLGPQKLNTLATEMTLVHLGNREILYREGQETDFIFLILSGSVCTLLPCEKSNTKIFSFLDRGEFLGIETVDALKPRYGHTAKGNEDATLLKIPIDFFCRQLLSIPIVQIEMREQISQRLLSLQKDICLSQSPTPRRIAQFLLSLLDRQAREMRSRIQIPLTRSQIAQKVGSQGETVTRILSAWTRSGWIETQDHHIEVKDRKALEKVRCHRYESCEKSNKLMPIKEERHQKILE